MNPAVIVLDDLTTGRRIRLARVALGLRQVDIAARAGVSPVDISNIELDRPIKRWKVKAILTVLGLEAPP